MLHAPLSMDWSVGMCPSEGMSLCPLFPFLWAFSLDQNGCWVDSSFVKKILHEVEHADWSLRQDKAGVNEAGGCEKDDEDGSWIASYTSGAEENIQCHHVE